VSPPTRDRIRWWVALTVPPAVWGARLLAGWTIAEIACDQAQAGAGRYLALQAGITAVAIAAIVMSALVAWGALRSDGTRASFDSEKATTFLGISGLLSALVFGLLVVVESSALLIVGC